MANENIFEPQSKQAPVNEIDIWANVDNFGPALFC